MNKVRRAADTCRGGAFDHDQGEGARAAGVVYVSAVGSCYGVGSFRAGVWSVAYRKSATASARADGGQITTGAEENA